MLGTTEITRGNRRPTKKKAAPSPVTTAERDRAANLFNAGRVQESEVLFKAMLARNRNDVYALYHVALIHYTRKQFAEALVVIARGIGLAPGFAPLWCARAQVLQAQGHNDQALESYTRALELQPEYTDVLLNSGVLLREQFQHHAALERFQRVLAIEPGHQKALANCATLLAQFGESAQAIAMFKRLLHINPDYPHGLGMLAYEQLRSCDWTNLEALTVTILDGLRAGRPVCRSFALMALPSTASDQYRCAQIFGQERFPKAVQPLWRGEIYGHDRIRLAYVSPDFREHPVSHLMSGIFERHDRTRFETIAISVGADDKSRFRRRLEKSFDRFIDMAGQGSTQIAQRIREMEVDILVDLAGYTSDGRPDIFAQRPAPIQAGFLGYPGTMGTDYYDFIVADPHVIPPEHEAFYSEKIVRLPDTYLPTDAGVQISDRTPSRAECGLPETGAVLCSFSHNFKINPRLFGVWMRLLQRLPGSVLWLAGRDGPMQANLQREAAARGVDPQRLVFAGRVPLVEDHLARYRLADLFLDTVPYNAHTTAADALMAGLPVVTCQGDAFPARVAGSLLHAIGLPELVTASLEDYESLVVELISDPARLQGIRARLQANRGTHALFDSDRFCRELEKAFSTMLSGGQTEAATAAVPLAAVATECETLACAPPLPAGRRLHIGGKLRSAGWEVLNALPGPCVDHLGNANDLSAFAEQSFEIVYASHVVEHFDYREELHRALSEWHRVLEPGGLVQISVPDLEVLASMIVDKQLSIVDRFKVMMMIFGGHVDAYDYHKVGLTEDLLAAFLANAGFVDIVRVDRIEPFADTSNRVFLDRSISLNVQARKPGPARPT